MRRPGRPTEHRELATGELGDRLRELGTGLTDDEVARLVDRVARS